MRRQMKAWAPRLAAPLFLALVYTLFLLASARDLMSIYWQQVWMFACITAISALGLNIIFGWAGLFSLGQAAFTGIGAYSSALITYHWLRSAPHIPVDFLFLHVDLGRAGVFLAAILGGTAVTAIVAYLIGLPLLRLKSDYLCVGTLGFNVIVHALLQNSDKLVPVMKGARGMVGIPRITSWPWVFTFTVLTIAVVRNLIYSSIGRAIISLREEETAAEVIGIDTARYRTVAFTMGCLLAGLSGALYAHLYAFLHPSTFAWIKSIDPFLIVVLGGSGSMTGTIVASFSWTFILEGLRVLLPQGFEDWRYVIYPVLLFAMMLLRPEGLLARRELGFLKAPRSEADSGRPVVTARAPADNGAESNQRRDEDADA